jgi:hypothetical protein
MVPFTVTVPPIVTPFLKTNIWFPPGVPSVTPLCIVGFVAQKYVTDAVVEPVVTGVDGIVVDEVIVDAATVPAPEQGVGGIGPVILLNGSPVGVTPVVTGVVPGAFAHFPLPLWPPTMCRKLASMVAEP